MSILPRLCYPLSSDAKEVTISPEVAQAMFEAKNAARIKSQNFHYQRIDFEKQARQAKKAGNVAKENALWGLAQKAGFESRKANDEYEALKRQMKAVGLNP